MVEKGMTYAGTGVDYEDMDPFKIEAQIAARETAGNISRFSGFSEVKMSRGESAYLIETPTHYLAHVEEGLGTKNLVADTMGCLNFKKYYSNVAQDTVAMIVNDMITLGALPLSVAMHLAVGDSGWFGDVKRRQSLISGWRDACNLSRCNWGCGETPTLKDIVIPGTVVLSGSAIGIIANKKNLISAENIRSSDAIVIVESSGIHANGLTLARAISKKLPDGYSTKMNDGRSYGETLLDPTYIYVPLIEECQKRGIDIHYAVNITGHGWRKLMRATQPFEYVIDVLPKQPQIFDVIQGYGKIKDEEMFGNFNMGAGFALYVPISNVSKTLRVAAEYGYKAIDCGHIQKSDSKKVRILPKRIEFLGDTLKVR